MSAAFVPAIAALLARLFFAGFARWVVTSYVVLVALHTSDPDRRAIALRILRLIVPRYPNRRAPGNDES